MGHHRAPDAANLACSINGDVGEAEENVPLPASVLQRPEQAADTLDVSVNALPSQTFECATGNLCAADY